MANKLEDDGFGVSIESLPHTPTFLCLSLKFGAITSSLLSILYFLLCLAQCGYALKLAFSGVLKEDGFSFEVFRLVAVILTISNVISFSLSVLLLVGVLKEKPKWMKPWIMWISFLVLTYIIMFLLSIGNSLYVAENGVSLYFYFADFLVLVIRIYMLMIVSSYCKELLMEQNDEAKFSKIATTELYMPA